MHQIQLQKEELSVDSTTWSLDPTLPILIIKEPRLHKIFHKQPLRCSTINEYALASGLDAFEVIKLLQEHLDSETLALEPVGGEVFINTAPNGRPTTNSQVPPNTWEILRRRLDLSQAFTVWKLVKDLTDGGWVVEIEPRKIPATSLGEVALAGLKIGAFVAPLLVMPPTSDIAHPAGLLTRLNAKSIQLCSIVVPRGGLDEYVTAVRSWMLDRQEFVGLNILLLEAPMLQPVLISPSDSSIEPITVTRSFIENLFNK